MNLRIPNLRQHVLVLLIPAFLLLTAQFYRKATGICFLSTVDPEYAYLFNGMLLADLHPDIYYVDHPGTPLMCIIALVSRVVHLFRSDASFVSDVMVNPEVYIHASVVAADIICAMALFLLGWFVLRKTGKILPALLLQTLAFVHTLSLEPLSRLIPESLMTAVVCFWMILLTDVVTSGRERWKRSAILMGSLYGFGVALKLTFLPYLFIPMLVLPRWKYRLYALGMSFLSFLVFAFPVLSHRIHFVNWVKNIVVHTGKYGQGERGFVNPSEFTEHLQLLTGNNQVLLAAAGGLAVALAITAFRKYRNHSGNRVLFRLGIAFLLIVMLQFIMAAKQFSYHYMLPAILLTMPMIFLAFYLIFRDTQALRWLVVAGPLVVWGYIGFGLQSNVRARLSEMEHINGERASAYHQYQALKTNAPTLVVCSYYGCSAVEYALTFGIQESGKYADNLTEQLHSLYPGTWLYYPWAEKFYDGRREVLPESFLKPGEYNLLVAGYSETMEHRVSELLTSLPVHIRMEKVYADSAVSEALFRLRVIPVRQ
jgi:hypothetical protein